MIFDKLKHISTFPKMNFHWIEFDCEKLHSDFIENKTTFVKIGKSTFYVELSKDIKEIVCTEEKITINGILTLEGRKLTYKDIIIPFSPYEYEFKNGQTYTGVLDEFYTVESFITKHEIPKNLPQNPLNWSEEDAFYYALKCG